MIYECLTGEDWPSSNAPTITAFTPCSPPNSSRETTVAQRGPGAYRVIEGDMIEAPFGVKYRLLGFDTPETYFLKCDEELALGRKATRRLKELLSWAKCGSLKRARSANMGGRLHTYM